MALALIGESILAAVLEVLMERIVSPAIRDFFKSQKIDDGELKKLKARMRKGVREVQIELTKILKNLEVLVDQKDVLGLIERIGGEPSLRRTPTTSLVDESGLLYKEMVVSNDRSLKSSFDLKAWVYVYEELDVLEVTKNILKGVGLMNCDNMTEDQLHCELERKLSGNKLLLVLDDVWSDNRSQWEFLLKPFMSVRQGSKIIVTTRNENVASIISSVSTQHIKKLSDDDCWLVLSKHAFDGGDFSAHPGLEGDNSGKTTERTRHLSYRATKDDSDQTFMAIKNPRLLRTLLCPRGWPSQLVELPANMGSLINLRHLDIHHTKLPEMPLQMGKLTKLRKLTDFFIGKQSGSSIKELGEVHHLSGALSVWNLQNVTDARDAFEANLKGKEHLEKLELIWDCDMDNSLVHERVLEQLQPPANVKILSINGYGGTRFPDWVGNSSLPLLEELYIRSCPDLKKALFTHFPSLTKLDIGACEQFEIEFFPLDLFPKLESLTIGSCPSLVSFSKGTPIAPNLKELKLRSCSNLKSLPENMRSFLTSLEKLSIFHCPRLESFPAGGLPSKLEGLAIWGCDKLVAGRTQWDLQSLHVLSRFSIAESDVLECFPEETLLPSSLTHLEIRTQKNLKSLNYKGLKHLTSLRELTIMNCMEVSMPEEGLPPSISSINIWQCPSLEKECEMGMRKVPKYLRCPEYMIPGRKSV
ncbi:hypothetical protein OIU76_003409 [Salix suchowensis]|nr:hypothetical protein OIU76_003409 [Salix suchowensis]